MQDLCADIKPQSCLQHFINWKKNFIPRPGETTSKLWHSHPNDHFSSLFISPLYHPHSFGRHFSREILKVSVIYWREKLPSQLNMSKKRRGEIYFSLREMHSKMIFFRERPCSMYFLSPCRSKNVMCDITGLNPQYQFFKCGVKNVSSKDFIKNLFLMGFRGE